MSRGIRIERQRLERGSVQDGLVLERALIADCISEFGAPDAHRPVISNSRFTGTTVLNSSLIGAVLRNVTIDGVKNDSFSGFLRANEFEQVTLKGRLGTLVISTYHNDRNLTAPYIERLREADNSSGWSLDIRDAMGNVEIRGYNVDRVRLDPSRQGIVRREALRDRDLSTLDFGRSAFGIQIQMMLERGWDGTVLCPNYNKRPNDDLQVLTRLRDEGVAE